MLGLLDFPVRDIVLEAIDVNAHLHHRGPLPVGRPSVVRYGKSDLPYEAMTLEHGGRVGLTTGKGYIGGHRLLGAALFQEGLAETPSHLPLLWDAPRGL